MENSIVHYLKKLKRLLLFPHFYKIVIVMKFHKSAARKVLDKERPSRWKD